MSAAAPKEVLLIESDSELRAGLASVLKLSKYKVTQVSNIADAIKGMKRNTAPIFGLILNFVIFRDSGRKLLACAAEGNWQFKVILAMMSIDEKKDVPKEFKNESVKLIEKPFQLAEFLKLLKI